MKLEAHDDPGYVKTETERETRQEIHQGCQHVSQRELLSGMGPSPFRFSLFSEVGFASLFLLVGETKTVQRMATELFHVLIRCSNKLKTPWLLLPQTEQGGLEV